MKSISTFVLSLFAIAAFGQNNVCAVMSPISQFAGQPIGQLQLEVGTTTPATVLNAPNAGGCLDLTGLSIANGSTLRPYKNINAFSGVSSFDLVKISQHILGITPFTTCYHLVAADINVNGMISTLDLVELRKVILGVYTNFPNNTSWRFVPKNCTNPCTGSCSSCVFGSSTNMDCEFFGIKIGDLSGDANPANFAGDLSEDRAPVVFSLENRDLKAGQTLEIPVFLENENALFAWQFALKFDPTFIEIQETQPELLDGSEAIPMVVRSAPGRVAMNWFSASPRSFSGGRNALISLKINVLRDCKLNEVFNLENENLEPEAVFENETSHPISLIFSEKTAVAPAENLTAWPNPFSEKTALVWSQNEAGEAVIDCFDVTGRAVFSTKVLGEKGGNQFEIKDLQEGLFFVKIQAAGQSFSTKIERR